ncbi:C-type lectin domain-containing protein, partial [Aphanizomenon sp. 202]|nr:C-type lectin domain-containing protein [Aphanizomenon sp. 202]
GAEMQSAISILLLAACVFAEHSWLRSHSVRPVKAVACNSPYIEIGGRCLMVDSVTKGTWADMRGICQLLNGDLVKIDSLEIMSAIVEYIKNSDFPDSSFWVGANDEGNEGAWTWPDGTPVIMGFPLWDQCTSQQPDGDQNQNCAIMAAESCFFLHDVLCDSQYYGICEGQ